MENRRSLLLLILASATWGLSFPVVDYALRFFSPSAILAVRFVIAVFLLGAWLAHDRKLRFSPSELKFGVVLGVILFAAIGSQTLGQQTVDPSSTAFITGLYILFVPLIASLVRVRWPDRRTLLYALVALSGLWLLSGATFPVSMGEGLVLACALLWAVHIMVVSRATELDAVRLTFVQLATCAVLGVAATALSGSIPSVWPALPFLALAYLGVFCSAFAYWAQITAQKHLAAEQAALIMLSEPVFAAIFGVLFFGVILSPAQWAGGAIILLSMAAATGLGDHEPPARAPPRSQA